MGTRDPQPLLRVGVAEDGIATVVTAAGEIDVSNAERLSAALDDAIATGAGRVVADLVEVEFIDSTGVRALLRAYERLAQEGGAMAIAASGSVRRILALLSLDESLQIADTRADALRALDD